MKPKSTDEKRAAVRSVLLTALFQLSAAGGLLYARTLTRTGWLRGLALVLALSNLVTIPFAFAVLRQRVKEIEKGELEEARKY